MEKKEALGLLAVLFLGGILFTPMNSNLWVLFLIVGIVFGALYIK
jgi:4-hydroxybenzoate polyprenyltransferase